MNRKRLNIPIFVTLSYYFNLFHLFFSEDPYSGYRTSGFPKDKYSISSSPVDEHLFLLHRMLQLL